MCNFVTQQNATDVSSFEGACSWHVVCRKVHQSCYFGLDSFSDSPVLQFACEEPSSVHFEKQPMYDLANNVKYV